MTVKCKLSRKKAFKLCLELWEWIAETNGDKQDWPGWEKYGGALCDCWFCEYGERQEARFGADFCHYCPLHAKYGSLGCRSDSCTYNLWVNAGTRGDMKGRKKYAKLFVKEIKEIIAKEYGE